MFDSEEKERQPELFSDLPAESKRRKRMPFNLGRIAVSLSYENILILTIGLVMLLIVCYSLGVEQGRHLAKVVGKDIQEVEIIEQGAQAGPAEDKGIKDAEIAEEKEEQAESQQTSPKPLQKKVRVKVAAAPKYTIQVATFRTEQSVEKEKQRLEGKGYRPYVISRGQFSEICVGAYQEMNEASGDLQELKKIYGDCYVRNR